MMEKEDILQRKELKKNPFTVPENYFDTIEESVAGHLAAPAGQRERIMNILKPALALACSFALVFGIGWSIMSLTGTLDKDDGYESDHLAEMGILDNSFIEHYESDSGDFEYEEEKIEDEDIISFISDEYSSTSLSFLLADVK